jgi:hypothetical protein
MANFAILDENNKVVNVIIADSADFVEKFVSQNYVDCADFLPFIGSTYNEVSKVFTLPTEEPTE